MNAARDLKFSVLDKHEVSALLLLPKNAACLLVMGHGAGAGMNHPSMTAIANELAGAGIVTFRYQFPYMEEHRGVPDPQPVLTATVAAAVQVAAKCAPKLPLFAGGKSMGGRMTSLAAAEQPLGKCQRIGIFWVSAAPAEASFRQARRSSETGESADAFPAGHAR